MISDLISFRARTRTQSVRCSLSGARLTTAMETTMRRVILIYGEKEDAVMQKISLVTFTSSIKLSLTYLTFSLKKIQPTLFYPTYLKRPTLLARRAYVTHRPMAR